MAKFHLNQKSESVPSVHCSSMICLPRKMIVYFYHVRAWILPCQLSEIASAAVVVVAGATLSNFTDSFANTEYAKRPPRPTDRPRPRGQEEAGATNNNSFELKTNSALGGHEGGQAPRRTRRQCRPDFRGCILIPHPIQVPNLVITSVEGCYLIFLRLRSPDPPLSNEAELVACSALAV